MMSLATGIGVAMLCSLILYALSGGADYGGGVWDLLARGPRAREQRESIARAIAPIWEANHVWLIVVVVLLFVAFPPAFGAIGIALHVPLVLMLLGLVLRGSAFVFRTYGAREDSGQRRWGLLFSISSIITPVMLGTTSGAVASGALRVDLETGHVETDFISSWAAPFPLALGAFTLALFAFLAAVYLILEVRDRALQEDFRRCGLAAGVVAGGLAWACFLLAGTGAPLVYRGLSQAWWSLPFQLLTGIVAAGALAALWKRWYRLARILAAAQVALIILGWGLAQYPYIIVPDVTFANAASPTAVLRPLAVVLGIGTIVIAPAFWYLYTTFKSGQESSS